MLLRLGDRVRVADAVHSVEAEPDVRLMMMSMVGWLMYGDGGGGVALHELSQTPRGPRLLREKAAVVAAGETRSCGRRLLLLLDEFCGGGIVDEASVGGAMDLRDAAAAAAVGVIEVAAALRDAVDRVTVGASIGGPDPAQNGDEYV